MECRIKRVHNNAIRRLSDRYLIITVAILLLACSCPLMLPKMLPIVDAAGDEIRIAVLAVIVVRRPPDKLLTLTELRIGKGVDLVSGTRH